MVSSLLTDLAKKSQERLKRNALGAFRAASSGIRPDPHELLSDWSARYRIVPDMGALPGPWRNEVAPYLCEPMDALSPDDPCEQVVIIKPAQSGGSAVAENWLGFVMHRTPGPAMYIGPTVKAAKDWYQEKLGPTIAATPVLSPAKGGVVAPSKSRSGEGSTSERIRFKGGFLLLAGANSAATLRQHSIRFMVRDDRSAWTDNADGEGDPKALSDQRLKTYRVFGLAKVLDVSSPKLAGSDIDGEYAKSDQRRYYVACKACRALSDLDWEDVEKNPEPPFRCRVKCPACGAEHTEGDKRDMLAAANGATWIPTAPDANGEVPPKTITPEDAATWRARETGRFVKGYAITGFISAFERWEQIAAEEKAAGDDPELLQPFQNAVLGRAYEVKGDGPQWELLAARKEAEWQRGQAPAGVLYVTLTADVQSDGIYFAFLGWGPNKQCWHLDYGFLPGETDGPLEGAWPKLDVLAERGVAFAGTRVLPDLIGVDSGYNVDAVYSWVKRRHNALALKGVEGWSKLPIFRAETPEVKKVGKSAGRARRYSLRVWLVGTYGIKAALMVYLARLPKEGGAALPTGYQHFPANAEEDYFRQLVSEYVHVETGRDGPKRVWLKRGPNHWLDCTVYGWALSHYVGLWSWSEARWEARARDLAALTKIDQADLFQPAATVAATSAPVAEQEAPAVAVKPTSVSRYRRGGASPYMQ